MHEAMSFGIAQDQTLAALEPFDFGVGVDVFFVISGFIMAYITADKFGRPGASGQFLTRRLIRLVPLYWLFTLAMLAAMVLVPGQLAHTALNPAHILASYLFIPWLDSTGLAHPILGLGWTLNYEMYFYVIFAVMLFLPRRIGLWSLAVLFCALALLHPAIDPAQVQLSFWTDPIILEFLFGIGLAMLGRQRHEAAGLGGRRAGACRRSRTRPRAAHRFRRAISPAVAHRRTRGAAGRWNGVLATAAAGPFGHLAGAGRRCIVRALSVASVLDQRGDPRLAEAAPRRALAVHRRDDCRRGAGRDRHPSGAGAAAPRPAQRNAGATCASGTGRSSTHRQANDHDPHAARRNHRRFPRHRDPAWSCSTTSRRGCRPLRSMSAECPRRRCSSAGPASISSLPSRATASS